ncbi:MAG: 4-hydroxy-tetrahydrodipicolinate synthase, partial [Spirochaetaceae bacterium]|nr:4-hydroxy-tetrahydrodipicolinate synthase [Spirochaetaceae bacterium]
MAKLQGAFTALVTPMFEDGSINYEGWRKLIQLQLEGGISGLVPLGTTGETPTLEESPEEEKLIEIVVSEVKQYKEKLAKEGKSREIPIILGASSNNTKDAVKYVKRAKEMGADYALVVTPYYNKPSDEGIFRHFEEVSKVGMPIIVYNIAGRTGKNINTNLLCRIAELPNIAGVKEASGDINQMMDVVAKISRVKPEFSVLSGDDGLTLPLIAAGGDGVISVVSNIAPSLVTELVTKALEGKVAEAREIHYRLLPFFKADFVDGNPTSIKYAMNYKGLPAGSVR